MSWLARYWAWAGSNIGAMPAQTVISGIALMLLRSPIVRLLRRATGLEKIARTADAAHRIAADLYMIHTGKHHPKAPAPPDGAGSAGAGQNVSRESSGSRPDDS